MDRAALKCCLGKKGESNDSGLSGSGKSLITDASEQTLHEQGLLTYILDSINVRLGLSKDPEFTVVEILGQLQK